MRRFHPLLVVAAAAATLLPAASAGAQTKTAPCIPGTSSPSCKWWTAKVTFIADGDTIKVRVDNDPTRRERTVRFIGINAMELHRYSKYPDRRRGECHGLEATALVERYVKRSGWRVWLAAQHASSESGGRLRRSVWVRSGGTWLDLAKIVMQQGQALWLPNGDEWAHNLEYHQIAQQVANAGLNLWNTRYCGAGPDDDLPITLSVNWDADGNDAANLNGEWVDIRNKGARDLPLNGWWIRDSWLNYGPEHRPGYAFPPGTVVPAGRTIRVHMGCGGNSLTDLHWCHQTSVFENATYDRTHMGDGAYLFDPQGDLRAWQMYPCVLACLDPLQGKVRLVVHPQTPEFMTITNTSAAPIDLQGYILKEHLRYSRSKYVFGYHFRDDSILNPLETMMIWVQGSPRADTRLTKFIGRPQQYVLADGGNAVDLRTDTDIQITCFRWGTGGVC